MYWDRIQNNWQQVQEVVKVQWDKFTDDHLDAMIGGRDELLDRIQQVYGLDQEQAERELGEWEAHYAESESMTGT